MAPELRRAPFLEKNKIKDDIWKLQKQKNIDAHNYEVY
jgi:hypothetical protein